MRIGALVIFLSAVFIGALQATEAASIHWREDLASVKRDQSSSPKPVLLYITSPGCSYCVKMKSDTFAHRDVVVQVRKKFTAVKLDARKHAAVSERLRVKLFPTTAIVHSSGAVVDVIPGYLGPQEFLERLADAEKKLDYQTKLLATKPSSTIVRQ